MPHEYGHIESNRHRGFEPYYQAPQQTMAPRHEDFTNHRPLAELNTLHQLLLESENAYKKLENEKKMLEHRLSEPCNACSSHVNEKRILRQFLSELCDDCMSLRNSHEILNRTRQFETEQASKHQKEHAEQLSRSREENRRDRDTFELTFKSAQGELQRSRQEKEQLRIQLFTAWKAARKFDDAERIYHEIMAPLHANDRGAKSDLMSEYADMLIQHEKYEKAEMVAREALSHRKSRVENQGQWSQELKLSYRQLSSALYHQSSTAKQNGAIEMHRQIWVSDSPHDWKAENGDRLCQIYADRKQYEDAERIQQKVWKERRRHDGIQHEATINSAMQRIDMLDGVISMSDRKHRSTDEKDVDKVFWENKIRDFLTKIWDSVKELPEINAKMLTLGHRLGEAHHKRKNNAKAREVFEQVWEGRKKSLGVTHLETLESGHRLGEIYHNQKEYAKAEVVFDQVWNGKKKRLGDNNPETLAAGHRLGEIHCNQKEYPKAAIVFGQVWNDGRKNSLGDHYPETLSSGHRLGEIHYIRKEYAKAEIVFDQVWDGRKSSLGEQKPETFDSGYQLARCICAQVDCDKEKFPKGKAILEALWEAIEPALEDLAIKNGSSSSYEVAAEIGCLYGSLLAKFGNFAEAEKMLMPLWELKINSAGEASQLQAGHLWGVCLARQCLYSKAREVLDSVLIRRELMSGSSAQDCMETSKELEEVRRLEKRSSKGKTPQRRGAVAMSRQGGIRIK